MIQFGVNVDPRHGYSASDIVQRGSVPWIRSVVTWNHDLTPWLLDVRVARGKNLVVVARESIKPGTTYTNTAKQLRAKYGEMVDAWQIGNEPDSSGGSSWSMLPAQFDALLWAFRSQMPNATLVAGGLVGGDANYLRTIKLSRVDAIAVHPYGQRVHSFPGPNWGFGEVGSLLGSYGRYNKPIWVTEFGGTTVDYEGGIFAVEDQRAEYHGKMLLRLHELGVPVACVFCWADTMVPGFGLVIDTPATAKATYAAFYHGAAAIASTPVPPSVAYLQGVTAGWFAQQPQGVIIHSTRSGTNNDEVTEFDATVRYVANGAAGLGWHATIGPGRICGHMPANMWGWNARQHSATHMAIELAQSKLGGPISNETVDAAAYWIKHYALPTWPNLLMNLIMHSELPAGIADGKTDAAPRGSVEAEQLRARLLARL